ncbi:MAG: glycosyltransferase, partial [Streptococcaceae bacterium]|nr:glycosyltransferase [Streptococcaceae bacterium]
MKIAFLSPTGKFTNGAEISIFELMKVLRKKGHTIYNLTSIRNAEYKDKMKAENIHFYTLKSGYFLWWKEASRAVGRVVDTKVDSYFKRNQIKEIAHFLLENDIELMITNTVNMPSAAIAAKMVGIPHYTLIHEYPELEFSYYREKFDFVDEMNDKVFCITETLRKQLLAMYPAFTKEKFATIYPYVEMDFTQKLADEEITRIVVVGAVGERKNQKELFQAV